MQKILLREAVPGMILARTVTVLSKSGRELIQSGIMLEKSHIKKLKYWDIEYIYIQSLDDDKSNEQPFNEAIRLLAHQTYEDAIISLAKMSVLLREKEYCELKDIAESVTQIIELVSMEESILSLLARIRTSDEYLYRHSVDVCVIALVIGKRMELNQQELRSLGIASLLHDIGMMKFKKDMWDDCMFTCTPGDISRHPIESRKMAGKISEISPEVLDLILKHHEYVAGNGYPGELKEDQISLATGTLGVAEAYCTLTMPHNPQKAMDPHEAVITVLDSSAPKFHTKVLNAFISCIALYPPGTFVLLGDECRAVVVATNRDKPLRPRVLVLYDSANKPVKPYHLDLGEPKNRTIYIEKAIPPINGTKTIEEILKK